MSLLGEMAPLLQRGVPGPQEGGRVGSLLGVTSPCPLSRWASGWGGDRRLPVVHCLSLESTGSGGLTEFAQGPRRPNKNKTALGSLALLAFYLPVAFLPHSSAPPFLPILFSSHLQLHSAYLLRNCGQVGVRRTEALSCIRKAGTASPVKPGRGQYLLHGTAMRTQEATHSTSFSLMASAWQGLISVWLEIEW